MLSLRATLLLVPVFPALSTATFVDRAPAHQQSSDHPSDDGHTASVPRYDFRNGFWSNLHHFLVHDALEQRAGRPLALQEAEWVEAVAYYDEHLASRDLLFDEGMRAIDWALSNDASSPELGPDGLDEELRFVLTSAAPAYRARLWPEQRDANAAWIASVQAPIAKDLPAIAARLSAVFRSKWPAEPIRVDVLAYANWAGGYTSDDPDHIRLTTLFPTPSSPEESFETLVHESSHLVVRPLLEALASEARRQGVKPPRDLWHALLFYTVGEVVRDSPATPKDYVPYAIAHGLYARHWTEVKQALDEHWRPYVAGEVGFDEAVAGLVGAFASTNPPSSDPAGAPRNDD